MVESPDKVMPTMEAESGASAATEFSALLGQVEQRSRANSQNPQNPQAILLRQHFAAIGVVLNDDEMEAFYQTTVSLEPEQLMLIVKSVAAQILSFQKLGDANFGYSDWQCVQEIERNFSEFGLIFDDAELFELYQSDTADVFRLFRVKIHSNLRKMLAVISHENEKLPQWLEDILDAKPAAEEVVLADTAERESYKNLLNTMFDAYGLTNRRYLIEQVLGSWTCID